MGSSPAFPVVSLLVAVLVPTTPTDKAGRCVGTIRTMARNTSISLDDHFLEFLFREVTSGRYRSSSEVVRAGLRLLETQEAQVDGLRAALVAGEDSGAAEPFDFDAFIASKKKQ